jgi:hypothetical protein
MTLSAPAEREHIHTRKIEARGYRRRDGLWDIEGHLTDTKTYAFANEWRGEIAAGEPVHDMWIRLTLDDDFIVRDIEAMTAAGPFRLCPDIAPAFAAVKGLRVGRGWSRRIREHLGGVHGCTHLVEMGGAHTVAFRPIPGGRAPGAGGQPPHLDSCHAGQRRRGGQAILAVPYGRVIADRRITGDAGVPTDPTVPGVAVAVLRGRRPIVAEDEYPDRRGQARLAAARVDQRANLMDGRALASGGLLQRVPHRRLETQRRPPAGDGDVAVDQRAVGVARHLKRPGCRGIAGAQPPPRADDQPTI